MLAAFNHRSDPTTFFAPQGVVEDLDEFTEPGVLVCGNLFVSIYVFAMASASSRCRLLYGSSAVVFRAFEDAS
jgi:hypothetical protein